MCFLNERKFCFDAGKGVSVCDLFMAAASSAKVVFIALLQKIPLPPERGDNS